MFAPVRIAGAGDLSSRGAIAMFVPCPRFDTLLLFLLLLLPLLVVVFSVLIVGDCD